MAEKLIKPDYIFEVGWDICHKIGGINTSIATKASHLVSEYKDNLVLIGPDLWREPKENPYFKEDKNLLRSWREKAEKEGMRLKVGRWKVHGEPLVILVDFSSFVALKNDIFAKYWDYYKLDSISGGAAYIDSAMFGYAAGRVIESYCKYYLTLRDKCVANFHEWTSGMGLLYIKKNYPQVATVFTSHGTVLGRTLAAEGRSLYTELETIEVEPKARELNIVSKLSLEKISATNADVFTCVGEPTARECKQFLGRYPDYITPNGIDQHHLKVNGNYDSKRQQAREKLIKVASALTDANISENAMLIANAGRYEFVNKGINVFVEVMAELNKRNDFNREVLAFIMVPASNYGAKKDLLEKLQTGEKIDVVGKYVTHRLHESEDDTILNAIKKAGLTNAPDQKVKVVLVPASLDGDDGIFNASYADLLLGFDLTLFPSYYEPWGYTPLESIASKVPTITTNHSGIGIWLDKSKTQNNEGIVILERNAGIEQELINKIIDKIVEFGNKSSKEIKQAKEAAYKVSREALWENLVGNYFQAWQSARSKAEGRSDKFVFDMHEEHTSSSNSKSSEPVWKNMVVQSRLPNEYKGLEELAHNLWWCWNYKAIELWEQLDRKLWDKSEHNPLVLLKEISFSRLLELKRDEAFRQKYEEVYKKFKAYLAEAKKRKKPGIAYFSMEFGLHSSLKIYSGGLGLLAGDYLKEASDCNVDMVGIGLLYKFGYFTQQLSVNGEQIANYDPQNFDDIPVTLETNADGSAKVVQIALPGRTVFIRIWRADVGRIPLYLLDTNFDLNNDEDRKLTHQLYGGDNEHRLKQEMVLGIGGIRALDALEVDQDIYHCNEGHAAFISLERLRKFIQNQNFTFGESLEIVRASTLFTTHTPVPAGHDAFSEDLMRMYMGHFPDRLKLTWEEFMDIGREKPGHKEEKYSMSHLAINASQEVNGVSWLHGIVSKGMFRKMWEGYFAEESHIGYVTNGVHFSSWVSREWKELYKQHLDKDFLHDLSNPERWKNIYNVDDETIWSMRQKKRKHLTDFIKQRLSDTMAARHADPRKILAIKNALNEKTLTIGFARRFATYKRAHLLFKNEARLAQILNNPNRPVQFIFAGKAHPADTGGQALIKKIVDISNKPEFVGKIIFLPGYDIELASHLVRGVDIWLNTPTRPLEASGTSGMKAVMNGVMNFSVKDGWWLEGYRDGAGWALSEEVTYKNTDFQDDLDAETIYNMLESEIAPLFYNRDEYDIPRDWVGYVKKCIAEIAPHYTTKRMMDDYFERFYSKLYKRSQKMRKNDYTLAKDLSNWKKRVSRAWNTIEVESVRFSSPMAEPLALGEKYISEVTLDLNEMAGLGVGVELVVTQSASGGEQHLVEVVPGKLIKSEGRHAQFRIEFQPSKSGNFRYGIRLYPSHEELPHRQDFALLKWV